MLLLAVVKNLLKRKGNGATKYDVKTSPASQAHSSSLGKNINDANSKNGKVDSPCTPQLHGKSTGNAK